MTEDHSPLLLHQVMVSSTFTDLIEHRAALITLLRAQKLAEAAMENDAASLLDIIDSSLKMVRESSAYIGVISRKYGQTPECPKRNPKGFSITELEFNEALRLNRPILLFIMGSKYPVPEDDVEFDPVKRKKLSDFRDRAKKMSPDSAIDRVYAEFDSLEQFKKQVGISIPKLAIHLNKPTSSVVPRPIVPSPKNDSIPEPPKYHAEPDYIASNQFVGRQAQLDELADWAKPADSHTILLFEAIGGNGKSMLTWEWAKNRSMKDRSDWAGRFWYSFYERGAVMADFCRHALAYMTRAPMEELKKQKTPELAKALIAELHKKPWLIVLDGLERVLVAYHRIDAAELKDEEADTAKDKISSRDPCSAIRDEDDDLLRALAAAAPSKILISSRLTPRVLVNQGGRLIPGVRRVALPGLRPADAEALLRSYGVEGDSQAIQNYLTANCDCHPLVVGALAGLISRYLPARGNFDTWAADRNGGGKLDLARLDLIQRRNHILDAAFDALAPKARDLLSTLSLLPGSVDAETLSAVNPHDDAPGKLTETVTDLERRGLLQFDHRSKRYDLHPVVRGVASGRLNTEAASSLGQKAVDYFSRQAHAPYEQAETLDDVHVGLNLVRTLIRIGNLKQAAETYWGELGRALLFNLTASPETLSLLKPFFPEGWGKLPKGLGRDLAAYLANSVGIALYNSGDSTAAFDAYGAALQADLESDDWPETCTRLANMAATLQDKNRLAKAHRLNVLSLDLASTLNDEDQVFSARLWHFVDCVSLGRWPEADAVWQDLNAMKRPQKRALYGSGNAERYYAEYQFEKGALTEEQLALAERLAREAKEREINRGLHRLRGAWRAEQGEWSLAAASFQEAQRLARLSGIHDAEAETGLALAKFHLGDLAEPRQEAERLANATRKSHFWLARLFLAIGDTEKAKYHAIEEYKWASADGEPFVWRYDLNKAAELLSQLGVPIPVLAPYDPSKDEKFPWETKIEAAIEKRRAEKAEKEKKKKK